MKQQTELTVVPRKLLARSVVEKMQDSHDDIARRVFDLFAPPADEDAVATGHWFMVDSGLPQPGSPEDLSLPVEIEWVTFLSAQNANN